MKGKNLKAIIDTEVVPGSTVSSDTLNSSNVLDISSFQHYRINHAKLFSGQKNHINGMENLWNQAKRHMLRSNGVSTARFHLFLKECKWRFNTPQPRHQQAQFKAMGSRSAQFVFSDSGKRKAKSSSASLDTKPGAGPDDTGTRLAKRWRYRESASMSASTSSVLRRSLSASSRGRRDCG